MGEQIPASESLRVEFKSDARRLPDREIVETVVCLANTDGGEIYLGVEDDGTPTGLHAAHMDIPGLAALIANRTSPPLSVRVTIIEVDGEKVARIEVPRSTRLVATTDGTLLRRRLLGDGRPACVPMLPHEFATRDSDLGLGDCSARVVRAATVDDLDPVERHRLRQAIQRYGGDHSLTGLDDRELDAALGLRRTVEGAEVPTVAGLLLIGKEQPIRDHVPTHEVALQVLEGGEVRLNESHRGPLARLLDRIEDLLVARTLERELQVGLFRVPVPTMDRQALREAIVNALTHRDYARLGAVHIRWEDDRVVVSNPGGFVEGVRLDNILVVEPKPRNPVLADIFKRVGLAERTGRGVDLIYRGLLRYGRPPPSYVRSDANTVVVELSCEEAHLPFLGLVLEQEKRLGAPMPVDSLIVLDLLRRERRVDTGLASRAIQKDPAAARGVLERLVEAGLAAAHGATKGRTYTLSAQVYRRLGQPGDYVRQVGFDSVQREEMIKRYVREHGGIRRQDAIDLCGLSPSQASRLLGKLADQGTLRRVGERKGARYEAGPKL